MSEQIQTYANIPSDLPLPYPTRVSSLAGNTLVTLATSKDDSLYRIGLTPLSDPLLREHTTFGYQSPDVTEVKNHPDMAESKSWFIEAGEQTPYLYATKSGLDLIKKVGIDKIQALVDDPAGAGGVEIGRGAESIAIRLTLGNETVVLKTPNHSDINELNDWGFGGKASPPNYLNKIQRTSLVNQLLSKLPIQPSNFEFSAPIKEYFATIFCMVEEYIEGTSLDTIKHQLKDDSTNEGALLGKSKDYWVQWFEVFDNYTQQVEPRFTLANRKRHAPFLAIDLNPVNLIVRGFNPQTGKPIITIIDQAPSPTVYDSSAASTVFEALESQRMQILKDTLSDDATLEYLMNVPLPTVLRDNNLSNWPESPKQHTQ